MKTIILILCNLLICNFLLAQNITNTLGTSGTFTIKSGATNFLTLSQSTGNVTLLRNMELGGLINSTLTVGVITKNGARFLHNFSPTGADGKNTFLGLNSGNFTMSGTGFFASGNTGLGASSLFSNTTGFNNSAMGNQSLYSNTTGIGNTAVGNEALYSNTTASGNTAVGHLSLLENTTGYSNVAVGLSSLRNNTIGIYNTALGTISLFDNTEGNNNTAVGYQSLYRNITGSENTSVGNLSLNHNTTGNLNTAVGSQSLNSNTTAGENTAFSYQSLFSNTTGSTNTAIGFQSLYSNTTAGENTALGYQSLYANTTGYDNTAIGKYSLNSNTFGFLNTAIGFSTGSTITTGSNLTMIGYNSEPSSPTAVNQVTLGDGSVSSLRCNVTSISSLSDMRDKKNITDLSLGLDFISKLKPRQFNWDKREWYDDNISDGSKTQQIQTAGFIAQELDEVQTTENAEWLRLVLKDNPEKLEATYGNLLPVMVKAIQELNEENQNLKQRLAKYEETQNLLAKKLEQLETKENGVTEK